MQISSRFTIALHILTYLAYRQKDEKITSDVLAGSIQVNPVVVRNILSQLRKAGLIEVKRGQGGATILKPYTAISLFDVYQAVDSVKNEQLFSFHEQPNPDCLIGQHIHVILDDKLDRVQQAMEEELRSISLEEILTDATAYLPNLSQKLSAE